MALDYCGRLQTLPLIGSLWLPGDLFGILISDKSINKGEANSMNPFRLVVTISLLLTLSAGFVRADIQTPEDLVRVKEGDTKSSIAPDVVNASKPVVHIAHLSADLIASLKPTDNVATRIAIKPQSLHCAPQSNDEEKKRVRVGFSIFSNTGVSSPLQADTSFGLIYEQPIKQSRTTYIVLTTGLFYERITGSIPDGQGGTVSAEANALIIPFLIEYQFRLGKNFYIGPNIGLVYNSAAIEGEFVSGENFAYGVSLGADFNGFFVEGRYIGSGATADTGLILSLGARF